MCEALQQLYYLGAIDKHGRITRLGETMSQFPLEPALSKLLITAHVYRCLDEMLTICAMVRTRTWAMRRSGC